MSHTFVHLPCSFFFFFFIRSWFPALSSGGREYWIRCKWKCPFVASSEKDDSCHISCVPILKKGLNDLAPEKEVANTSYALHQRLIAQEIEGKDLWGGIERGSKYRKTNAGIARNWVICKARMEIWAKIIVVMYTDAYITHLLPWLLFPQWIVWPHPLSS